MPIVLSDADKTETYNTLEEAVAAAKAWYSSLETDEFKLPPWDYQIQNVDDLNVAIANHKAQLAGAQGCRDGIPVERLGIGVES